MADSDDKKFFRRSAPGTAPGTLVVPPGAPFPKITVIAYSSDDLMEREIADPAEIVPLLKKWPMLWINVDGLGSTEIIAALGNIFGLHVLALEDVVNLHQRPKAEQYKDYIYVALQMAHWRGGRVETEQLSIFIGKNFVLSFQEDVGDCFNPVRMRMKTAKARRDRFMHPDYLAYTILDAVIDEYFPILEGFGDRLDALEEEVVAKPDRSFITDTHQLKRELQNMRHGLWPMREMINAFSTATIVVGEETRPYLRDCHDHVIQALDMLETYRERASGLVDIYLSSISAHMNEIMKVLTIIATIFMPLSFIASLYGMNFDRSSPWNMPELGWRYGYLYSLGLMALSVIVMLRYFHRKGWLARPPDEGKNDRKK